MLTTIINSELNTRDGLKFIRHYGSMCHIFSAIDAINFAKKQLELYVDSELSRQPYSYDIDEYGEPFMLEPSQLFLNLELYRGNEHETRRILAAAIRARIQTIIAVPAPLPQLDEEFELPF